MGRNQVSASAWSARRAAVTLIVASMMCACSSDGGAGTAVVSSADAIAATVAWQAQAQPPTFNDDGEVQLPVIFVVAADGATIDVGVQADVTAATIDWATVRFADQVTDTFDTDLDGEPVRNHGAALQIGAMPEPADSIELEVVRYYAVDDREPFTLEITSDPTTTDNEYPTLPAAVTSVTRP